jgi:choline dehydrogenase-like flavoprotein
MARSARARAGLTKLDRLYSLYFRAEQAPDPSNRVALSDRRDALGIPETRLDWHIKPIDRESILAWLDVFAGDLRAKGYGHVIKQADDWQQGVVGGPHHLGTTKMSAGARNGVVDEHCRVHSVDNLYVAGSSVFPTGGYANPTFTIVTLALRLADTLRKRLQGENPISSKR